MNDEAPAPMAARALQGMDARRRGHPRILIPADRTYCGRGLAHRPIGSNVIAAAKWMAVAFVAFSLIAVAGRAAAQEMPTLDIIFYRGWLSFAIMMVVVPVSAGGIRQLQTPDLAMIGVRSAIHFVAQYSWFYALPLIALTQLYAIEFTAPLWTALLAWLVLGERMTSRRILAAGLGFLGMLIALRPASLQIGEGALFAFVAAVGYGCHFIATKYLMRGNSAVSLLFYTNLAQALLATLLAGSRLSLPGAETAVWLAALAGLSLVAHFALARAFALADATVVAPMDFLRLPLIAIVGFVVYAEPLEPLTLAGAMVIVLANLVNIWPCLDVCAPSGAPMSESSLPRQSVPVPANHRIDTGSNKNIGLQKRRGRIL